MSEDVPAQFHKAVDGIYFQTAELVGNFTTIPDACYQSSADGIFIPCSVLRKGYPRSSYLSGEAFQIVLSAGKGGAC